MIKHIAFIPDGNRRYAKKNLKTRFEGHSAGAQRFRDVLQWCKDLGIKEVTWWALSSENMQREKEELEDIFKLMDKFCNEFINEKKHTDVQINFIGQIELLPNQLQKKMHEIEHMTKNNSPLKLNLLVGYGGRHEITKAIKKIAEEVKKGILSVDIINEELVTQYMDIKSSPDLIIRTGRPCLSGLMPWQSTYSEAIFLENKLWPEFTKEDLENCLKIYQERTRNFGK